MHRMKVAYSKNEHKMVYDIHITRERGGPALQMAWLSLYYETRILIVDLSNLFPLPACQKGESGLVHLIRLCLLLLPGSLAFGLW